MNPIIGIVACGYMDQRQFVPQTYIRAMEDAGGIPCNPSLYQGRRSIPYYGKICDGFLFCGGDDVSPLLFGEELQTDRGRTDTRTDISHLSFMEYAHSRPAFQS